jgi:hypothetical protein
MAPPLIEKVKAAAKKKQAEVKGSAWKEQVVNNNDGQFQDFSHWKQQYEQQPRKEKKEDSAFVKEKKANVAANVKSKVLEKLTTGISAKLVQIILEVTCKILETIEHQELSSLSIKNNQEILSSLANNFKGLVLTFRFSKKKSEAQFRYLRQFACARLTTVLQKLMLQVDEEESKWIEIQSELTVRIRNHQSEVKSITLTLIADTVGTSATTRAEAFADSKLAAQVIEQGIATISLGDAEQIPLVLPKKDNVKDNNQVDHQFIMFLQDLIVSQMEPLMEQVTLVIQDMFGTIGQVVQTLESAGAVSAAEIDNQTRKELSEQVESVYLQLVTTVERKVKDMMTVLEAMMDNSGEDDEEEDDTNSED